MEVGSPFFFGFGSRTVECSRPQLSTGSPLLRASSFYPWSCCASNFPSSHIAYPPDRQFYFRAYSVLTVEPDNYKLPMQAYIFVEGRGLSTWALVARLADRASAPGIDAAHPVVRREPPSKQRSNCHSTPEAGGLPSSLPFVNHFEFGEFSVGTLTQDQCRSSVAMACRHQPSDIKKSKSGQAMPSTIGVPRSDSPLPHPQQPLHVGGSWGNQDRSAIVIL